MTVAWRSNPGAVRLAFDASSAARWDVSFKTFNAAVAVAIEHRFRGASPTEKEIDAFVHSLHAEDLALACACRDGHNAAWEHFVAALRPQLYIAGRSIAGAQSRDMVDSLMGDLFGVTERDGQRRSLLAYYHGRARLLTWLRTVLAQRHIDLHRASSRTVPIEEQGAEGRLSDARPPIDPYRDEHLGLAQHAFDAAVDALAARDRLRLRLYYGEEITLSQVGRVLGEHEATVSRAIARSRRHLRETVVRALQEQGLAPEAVQECLEHAASSAELDLSSLLTKREQEGEQEATRGTFSA